MKKTHGLALLLLLLWLPPLLACAASLQSLFEGMCDEDLLQLHADLIDELESRGLISTTERAILTTRTEGAPLVWIPKTGSRYHDDRTCSKMKDPSLVSLDVAVELGFSPCSKCYD